MEPQCFYKHFWTRGSFFCFPQSKAMLWKLIYLTKLSFYCAGELFYCLINWTYTVFKIFDTSIPMILILSSKFWKSIQKSVFFLEETACEHLVFFFSTLTHYRSTCTHKRRLLFLSSYLTASSRVGKSWIIVERTEGRIEGSWSPVAFGNVLLRQS